MLLGGAAWLCARAIPKCTHGENSYSFPITVEGKTTLHLLQVRSQP
jgi:hypothetical protein